MISHIRKHNVTFIGLITFTGLVILALVSGVDFFHNHTPDLNDHDDCIAFHIYALFSAALLFVLLLYQDILNFKRIHPGFPDREYFIYLVNPSSRAPPRSF